MQVKFHFSFTSNIKQKVEILHVIHKYPILNYMPGRFFLRIRLQLVPWDNDENKDVIEDEDENKLTAECVKMTG